MDKRKPNIIAVDTVENESTLTLHVSADITAFKGHFKSFPILPGVTQIDWALHYAVHELNVPGFFKGMEVIKFQEPILPDATIQLSLKWDADKNKLSFSYTSNNGEQTHSSGKMKLGEKSE